MPDVHRDARVGVDRAVVVAGRTLVDVVAAVHLTGRLVARDVRVGVARGLRAVVVEDREVHRREQLVSQARDLRERVLHDDQAAGVPAVVDRGQEPAVVLARRRLGAVALARVEQRLAVVGVVPLVEEAVAALETLHRGQRLLQALVGFSLVDEVQVVGRRDRPQVHADVGRGRVVAARVARAEIVQRQVGLGIDVRTVEAPGVARDREQVGALRAGQAGVCPAAGRAPTAPWRGRPRAPRSSLRRRRVA